MRNLADAEVSLNFFYDNLSAQGSWLEVADYGYVFQPSVAVSGSDWRPYADGYWAYTDAGWTWVSYEDFGWATYHYGRWANLDSYGWCWVPGYEWGPAWVSWRTGGDYVGWAPLPPQGGEVVYEGRAITGNVDVSFGIGPLYYNFVDIRYIGEPVLRSRLIPTSRNVTIINNTVNVTNITYNNSIVINNGPDLNRVNQYSTRPVQRLTLQRETNVGADFASRRGNLNRVNGSTLMVAAPAVQRSQQKFAPKQVKAKVEKPKFEKGWQGISNRQQVEQEMKKGDAQNVPPPTFQPQKGREAEANAGKAGNAGNAGRAEQAAQPSQTNENAQATTPENPPNAREQKRQQAEQLRAERAQKAQESEAQPSQADQQQKDERARRMQERKAQPDQPSQDQSNQQPEAKKARMKQERNGQDEAQQSDRAAKRAERAQGSERPDRAEQAPQADESQRAPRPERAERPERAQQPPEAQQRPERAQSPQEAPQRPERAQRPQRERQPDQVRPQPQENNPNPDQPRKGKRNKPSEEPTPQG